MTRAFAALILLLTAPPALAQPADWDVDHPRSHGGGARIMVLRDYHLADGDTARGPVVVLGGDARIDGHADDDVVVFGGKVQVGPKSVIDGDLVAIGGDVVVDPQAKIYGDVNETVMRLPDIDGDWRQVPRNWVAGVALALTFLRLVTVFAVASLLVLIAPAWVRRISWRASAGAGSAAAIGLACQVGFVPAMVVLVVVLAVTVIGIPLIGAVPFVVAAAGVAGVAGFTAVAARIGARIRGTTVEASNALFVDMFLGFAMVSAVTVFARMLALGTFWNTPMVWSLSAVGFVIEYLVWTVGIGAACATALARWNGPSRTAPVAPVAAAHV
jgi:hypothetical protein